MFCAGKLGMGLVSSKQCRLPSGQICGELGKSPKSVPEHLTEDPHFPRYEGARNITQHVRARQGRCVRLTVRVENDPKQLS